jgi:hypothetical protein
MCGRLPQPGCGADHPWAVGGTTSGTGNALTWGIRSHGRLAIIALGDELDHRGSRRECRPYGQRGLVTGCTRAYPPSRGVLARSPRPARMTPRCIWGGTTGEERRVMREPSASSMREQLDRMADLPVAVGRPSERAMAAPSGGDRGARHRTSGSTRGRTERRAW